jgi:two-component system alkaline phosphatase synthesis response regulator PhoP
MQKSKILIVDNNRDVCHIYSETLKSAGYDVCSICDEEKAIQHILRKKPEVILLDLLMPKVSGMHILETIKRDHETAHLNVIILTELSDAASKTKALNKGADDYLIKSETKMMDLLKAIDKSLSK